MGKSTRNPYRAYWWLLAVSVGLLLVFFVLGYSSWNRSSAHNIIEGKAKSSAVTDLSTMGNLLEQFRLDMGRYPTTEEGLFVLREKPDDDKNWKYWKGPYIAGEIPLDPWEHEYYYEFMDGEDDYILLSFGADGEEGGEGFDADIYGSGG